MLLFSFPHNTTSFFSFADWRKTNEEETTTIAAFKDHWKKLLAQSGRRMYTRNNFVADYNPDEEEVRKCRKNLQSSFSKFCQFKKSNFHRVIGNNSCYKSGRQENNFFMSEFNDITWKYRKIFWQYCGNTFNCRACSALVQFIGHHGDL